MGFVKTNTDGSSKAGHATAGGILRTQSGNFLYGFSMPLRHGDIVGAELTAIFKGVLLCKRMNIGNFEIETDCSVAYQMISKPSSCHWKYVYSI